MSEYQVSVGLGTGLVRKTGVRGVGSNGRMEGENEDENGERKPSTQYKIPDKFARLG